MNFGWKRVALVLAALVGSTTATLADRIKNPTAVFSGLDKITGRIVSFEVGVDETVQFGALRMQSRVCFTKPPNENPNTTSFVEVEETGTDGKSRKVFSGWMFASSPGLHGVEHPVYDIWLVDCKGGKEIIPEPKDAAEELPPIEETRPAATEASRPGGPILAPGQVAPPPPPVQTAPLQQVPVQQVPVRRAPAQAPLINTDRTNDR